MTIITGGLIVFEDGKKAEQEYTPPKKARAELRFDLPEDADEDAEIMVVMGKAQSIVYQMLGGKIPVKQPAPVEGRTKADLAVEAGVASAPPTAGPKRGRGRPSPKAASTDPAAVVEEDFTVAADPAAVEDDFTVPPAAVTDADLNTAVQKKNATLKDPVKIRGLIATFNPDPAKQFVLAQIKQEQRRTFLDRLDALS